jgi:ferredoxin
MAMAEKDLYESLMRFYEFQLGQLPNRGEFKAALQSTFDTQDLRLFFLLPFFGMVPIEKLEKKAEKLGISRDEVHAMVKRLIPEGMVDSYIESGVRMVGRSPIIALIEFQVRLKQASPMREVCTKVMDAFIEGATDAVPTRTPYYRVLPVEAALTGEETGGLSVNAIVPDPREVLPIDKISEMLKNESLIAVADCYCRSTKQLIHEDCGHPLETCFYFSELAKIKLETGYARKIDYEEAMEILWEAEKAGLVHNVSNCEGQIQTLCNCCACSCAVMKAIVRGQTNVGGPSRYQSALIEEKCTYCGECVQVCPVEVISVEDRKIEFKVDKCIGCGHCVSACPEAALTMVLRERHPKIFPNNDALFRRINMEAMVGLATRRILGR